VYCYGAVYVCDGGRTALPLRRDRLETHNKVVMRGSGGGGGGGGDGGGISGGDDGGEHGCDSDDTARGRAFFTLFCTQNNN
jgi:hypothetical protein